MSSFHWKPQSALKKDQDRINQLPFSLLEAEIAVPVLDWERQQGEQHFFFYLLSNHGPDVPEDGWQKDKLISSEVDG